MKILIILVAVGCAAPASPHVISGSVEQRTFNAPVDQVVIVHGGAVVVRSPINNLGEFSVTIPPGSSYRLELTTVSDRSGLVNPRSAGTLDSTFAVRGGGTPFNVGMVRAIGSAAAANFLFGPSPGQCQDGKDANGNVCVDDQQAETCNEGDSADGEGDGADTESADDGQAPDTAAVADHNIPSSIGCGNGGDSGGDHQNDGEEQGDH